MLAPKRRTRRSRDIFPGLGPRPSCAPFFPLLLLVCLAGGGCEEEEEIDVGPTKPWRVGESPDGEKEERVPKVPFAVSEAKIVFQGGKETSFRGRLPRVTGNVHVPLEALEKVSGKLQFDVRGLVVLGDEQRPDPKRSSQARRWLSLGEKVAPDERRKHAQAKFEIRSAKLLSHRSVFRGAHRDPAELGLPEGQDWEVRTVRGTVVGELLLHGFAVQHTVRVDVDFAFRGPPTRDEEPERIFVELVESERVPFVEHQIEPRNASGHVNAAQLEQLGKEFSRSVDVSGTLTLQKKP